jgi:hypothetical protein
MSLGSEPAEPSEATGGEGRVSQRQAGRVEWARRVVRGEGIG